MIWYGTNRKGAVVAIVTVIVMMMFCLYVLYVQLPRGVLIASPSHGDVPLRVTFKAELQLSASSGGIFLYFGDGASQEICSPGPCSEEKVIHVYREAGRYKAELLARDLAGTYGLIQNTDYDLGEWEIAAQ